MNITSWHSRSFVSFIVASGLIFLSIPLMVQADTPAQAQKVIQAVCNRAVASGRRRDLAGMMAMYAPGYMLKNVTGRKLTYLQRQAGLAKSLSYTNSNAVEQATILRTTVQGNTASVVLQWHTVSPHRQSASAPSYSYIRDVDENTLWKKTAVGWQETIADMTSDRLEYRR